MAWLVVIRLVLAAVFAVAALSKLADRPGTRAAVGAFGTPAALTGPIAIALPVAELAVAIALLLPETALGGAVGALILLAIFSAAIAFNLARGRRPDCHCFGQVHSEPIGAPALIRNAALAAVAAVVVGFGGEEPGASAVAWIVSSPAVALAAGLAAGLAVATVIAFALIRRHGVALRRVDELEVALRDAGVEIPEPEEQPKIPIGGRVPRFEGMEQLLAGGRPILVAFTSPGCGPCRELAPKLARWREDHADLVSVAELAYDDDPTLADAYGVDGTPAAIVIGASGGAESTVAHGPDRIEKLFEETLLGSLPPPPDVGEPLPELRLEDLSAEPVGLRTALAHDRDTLLMFWNPGCGFCSAMRDDLRQLDEGPLNGHPSLLVVSAGDPDQVREDGFRSPVLLDPMALTSSAVGAGGTPTAVLIGPDGTVRSPIAGGRDAVLALAGVGVGERGPELEVVMAGSANEGKDQG